MKPLVFRLCASALICAATVITGAQTSSPYAFSHLAGPPGGHGNADGAAEAARFRNPTGLALDSAGNLFVADEGNGAIRKVGSDGSVTKIVTLKTVQDLAVSLPTLGVVFTGVAVDTQDNLYLTDEANNLIFKRSPSGTLSLFSGKTDITSRIYPSTDGTLAQATFNSPRALAFDPAGNLYVADSLNHIIRKITPQGVVSAFAGSPPQYNHPQGAGVSRMKIFQGSADGPLGVAQYNIPSAIAADAAGNLYVTDTFNHTIRKVSPAGETTTLAGMAGQTGSADGQGSAARFNRPDGLAVDSGGNVFVADTGNGLVRKITPSGAVSTVAGSAGQFATVDGAATAARFVSPQSVLFDRSGRLLVGDGGADYFTPLQAGTIRRIAADGSVSTFAGRGGATGSTDGKGEAARFRHPADVAVDATGNVYVADDLNHTIRKIAPDGTTTTLAGSAGNPGNTDGTGNAARFNRPTSVAVDASGQLYVTDHDNHTIRKITASGAVTTLAGSAGNPGSADGNGGAARFHNPVSIAVDAGGTLYVGDGDYFPAGGDPSTQYSTIRKITPAGEVSTLAGNPVVVQAEQGRYALDGTGSGARFGAVTGIWVAPDGNLFVTDNRYGRICKVTPEGVVTTLPVPGTSGFAASLRQHPFFGITGDKDGNLYVSQSTGGVFTTIAASAFILRITPAGAMEPVTAPAGVFGSVDGVGLAAQFNHPKGLEFDSKGALYLADTRNNAIRKGVPAAAPVITAHPQNLTAAVGSSVQFSVTATGAPEPSYQWQFNGSPFVGGTGATLAFSNVRSSDAGNYTVVVSNSVGSVTSSAAALTVNTAPVPPAGAGGSGGSGGGGAPSVWFAGLLAFLAAARSLRICLRPRA